MSLLKIRFKPPTKTNLGWYICTLGNTTQYLHTDGTLHSSTDNDYDKTQSSGYFKNGQQAMDVLVEYVRLHLA